MATSVRDFPPTSKVASASAAGVGRYSVGAIVLSRVSSVGALR